MGWDAGMLHGKPFPPSTVATNCNNRGPGTGARTRMIFGMVAPNHVFLEIEFFLLVAFSFVLPVAIYGFLLKRASISRYAVIALAIVLIAIAGIDLYLLQFLADAAKRTPSAVRDDWLFLSQFSIALPHSGCVRGPWRQSALPYPHRPPAPRRVPLRPSFTGR